MGWTYRKKKWRDNLRKAYTEETGSDDYQAPEFWDWCKARIA